MPGSYWSYLEQIQSRIIEKSKTVLLIKTLFMKLASIMDQPLGRIMEVVVKILKMLQSINQTSYLSLLKMYFKLFPHLSL